MANVTRCSKPFHGPSFPTETLQHPWPGTKDSTISLQSPFPALCSQSCSLFLTSTVFSVPLSSHHHRYKPSFQVTFRTKSFSSSPLQLFPSSSEYPQPSFCLSLVQMIFSFIISDNFRSPTRHLSCVLHYIPLLVGHLHLNVPQAPQIPFLNQTHYLFPKTCFPPRTHPDY